MKVLKREFREAFVGALTGEEGGVGEGRKLELTSELKLLVGEAFVVMVPGKLDRRRVRGKGLDHYLSFHLASAGAAGDLGEQLESPFPSPKVGSMQRQVCIQDAGEGNVWEVEPLGNHLGSQQDIDLPGAEVAQDVPDGIFPAGCIRIEPSKPRPRKDLLENLLYFLGAVSLEQDGAILALRTRSRDDGLITTEVTDESFLGPVICERNGAMLALTDMAAAGALQGAGKAPAIQEENDLLAVFKLLFHVHPKLVG